MARSDRPDRFAAGVVVGVAFRVVGDRHIVGEGGAAICAALVVHVPFAGAPVFQASRMSPVPGLLAALAGVTVLHNKTDLLGSVPLDKPPEALADRAHDLLRTFGYTARPPGQPFRPHCDADYLRGAAQRRRKVSRSRIRGPWRSARRLG